MIGNGTFACDVASHGKPVAWRLEAGSVIASIFSVGSDRLDVVTCLSAYVRRETFSCASVPLGIFRATARSQSIEIVSLSLELPSRCACRQLGQPYTREEGH